MDLTDVVIETQRLRLAPISMDYAQDIFAEFTEEVTTFMYPAAAKEIEEIRAFISDQISKLECGRDLTTVILDKGTGQFLGVVGLHGLESARPEVGVWLKKSAHGSRLGFEAVSALVEWAQNRLDCKTTVYPVDERNILQEDSREAGRSIAGRRTVTSMSGRELRLLDYEIPLARAECP